MVDIWGRLAAKALIVATSLCLLGCNIGPDRMNHKLEFTVKDNGVSYLINGETPDPALFDQLGGYQGPDFDLLTIRDEKTGTVIQFSEIVRTNTYFNVLDVTLENSGINRGNNIIFYLKNGEINFKDAIEEGKRIQSWLDFSGFKPRTLPASSQQCGTLEHLNLLHRNDVPLNKVAEQINPIFDLKTRSLCSSAGAVPLSQGNRGAVSFSITLAPNQWLTDNPPPVEQMSYRLEFGIGVYP
ncbi:hypothetical protein [Aquidulcibacter sp.]|jgi:hypothetical protein|uniref:hypothetical protein n=1 Tax=Aquidulcibacter sp. TaxID=2052990 RepID=UPI0037C18A0B